jgi:hypothetical protein
VTARVPPSESLVRLLRQQLDGGTPVETIIDALRLAMYRRSRAGVQRFPRRYQRELLLFYGGAEAVLRGANEALERVGVAAAREARRLAP